MKKLNHYQKDILFILLLMALQVVFSYFYPFRNPDAATTIEVSRNFIILSFEFVDQGVTTHYFPFLSIIYGGLLVYLLLEKRRRFALIYGYAVVLVTKAYFLSELYVLEGTYTGLSVSGFFSKRVINNGDILAQDVSLYILLILLFIKIGIYVHDYFMHKKAQATE